MQCLSEIKSKRILLLVAHPDDETLWFFQSIKTLQENNEIVVSCLTHTATSERGKELSKLAENLNLKVVFGRCEDTGIDHLINNKELRQAFIKIFSKYKIDIAITHPPHGGEKPHPHHIQLYKMTKEFCQYYSVKFGFFSEQKLLDNDVPQNYYHFGYKKKKYIINRLLQGHKLLSREEKKSNSLLSGILSVLFNFKSYIGFEVSVDLKEKQTALANFESQVEILKGYNAYYKKSEFLFLEKNIHEIFAAKTDVAIGVY